jgi:hypothetical protein
MKLLNGVQLVKVQPGQSRSGQAGSECCVASGDRWGEAYTARKRAARVSAPKTFLHGGANVVSLTDGCIGTTGIARSGPDRRSACPGQAFKGTPQEPGRALYLLTKPGCGSPQIKNLAHRWLRMRRLGERMKHPAEEVPGCQGRPEAFGKGREQSYEAILPMKVGNRRAPETGGHGTHWRQGLNKPTYRRGDTWRYTDIDKTCQRNSTE